MKDHKPGDNKAIFAGSLDPPTNGHLWLIEQGSLLFESLEVVVATNSDKNHLFTTDERVALLEGIVQKLPNVTVAKLDQQYTANYARDHGVKYLLRGLRSADELTYERDMYIQNMAINPDIQSVFLMAPAGMESISSTAIKRLMDTKQWDELAKLVPAETLAALVKKQQ